MRRAFLALALVWLSVVFAASPAIGDDFQRGIKFRNDFDFPVYPVIKATKADNCGGTGQLRIVINAGGRGTGLPAHTTLEVNIPKNQPCETSGFYNAARIIVLFAKLEDFEAKIPSAQRTMDISAPWATDVCPGCWVGQADSDYTEDAPVQLLEYTIISQAPDGTQFPDPNNPAGTSFLDFDLSFVDSVYLPATIAPAGGISPFMGSSLMYDAFNTRLNKFLNNQGWSRFAAYSTVNWLNTVFKDLVPNTNTTPKGPQTPKVPSAAFLISQTRKIPASRFPGDRVSTRPRGMGHIPRPAKTPITSRTWGVSWSAG